MSMTSEKLFNIVIFQWKDWYEINSDVCKYYGVQWELKELENYNDRIIIVDRNWNITILKEDERNTDRKFNLIEIQEFKDLIKSV